MKKAKNTPSKHWRNKIEIKTDTYKIIKRQNISQVYNNADYYELYDKGGRFVAKDCNFNVLQSKARSMYKYEATHEKSKRWAVSNTLRGLKKQLSEIGNDYFDAIDEAVVRAGDVIVKFQRINKKSPNNMVVRGTWN